jgi:hypothetical protein
LRASESAALIGKQVQLALSNRTKLSEGREFAVFSPLTWRLADLGAKHAFLKAGLGWGHMTLHMVKAVGVLVKILVEGVPRDPRMSMKVVYREDAPGPAARPSSRNSGSSPASMCRPSGSARFSAVARAFF